MIDIQWHPTRKELRVFSALLIAFCGFVAVMVFRRTGDTTWPVIIAAVGSVIGIVGCVWPPAVRPVYLAWMVAVFPIGWTVSHLLLGAIFYLVFTPIGWLLRITGHDPMKRRIERSKESYWELRPNPRQPGDYFRQF